MTAARQLTPEEAAAAIQRCAVEVTREFVDGREPEQRRVVHCFLGTIGADWDAVHAIDLLRSAVDLGYADSLFGYCLQVIANNRRYVFDTVVPEEVPS